MPVLLMLGGVSYAQINPVSDQYNLNLFQLNPAIAGTERYAPLTFNAHQQWMGWNGAPTMQNVSFHTRLRSKGLFFTPQGFRNKGKNSFGKIGLGGGFYNYSYGNVAHTGLHLDYAYHVILRKGRLAFGLSPTVTQFRIDKFRGLTFPDPTQPDPVLNDSTISLVFFDASAGMHYYSQDGYAGLSVVQLFGSAVRTRDYAFPTSEDPSLNPDFARTIYIYGGYFIRPTRDLTIEPMLLARYNMRSGMRFDLNTYVHFKENLMVGAGYRWKEGFNAMMGMRLDNFEARYQFEIPLTSQVPGSFTSHTIQLTFYLGQPIE